MTTGLAETAPVPGIPRRAIVVVMCFLATVICYVDRVSMSVAVIPMADELHWDGTTKGVVLSAFFIGYMLAMVPGGWLAGRYGGRLVLGVALILWSLFTLVTPLAAALSFAGLITARIGMGLGEAATFPAAVNLFARWLPVTERSRAVAFNLTGISVGTVVGLLASGWIVATWGWPAIFYVFGGIGLVFTLGWFALVHDRPAVHPAISPAELALLAGCIDTVRDVPPPTPWAAMLRHPAVWALTANHFCATWLLYLMLTWLPSYFRDIQKLDIAQSGLFSIGPWLAMFLFGNLGGVIADRLVGRGWTVTSVRRLMQVGGMAGASAALLVASGATTPLAALGTLCVAMAFLGLTWSGFACNHLDIAPRHADVLYGFTNTIATLPGIFGVVLTGWLLDVTGGYTATFIVAAGVSVAGALLWWVWGTGEKLFD